MTPSGLRIHLIKARSALAGRHDFLSDGVQRSTDLAPHYRTYLVFHLSSLPTSEQRPSAWTLAANVEAAMLAMGQIVAPVALSVKLVFCGAWPAVRVSRSQTPCAPALFGAAPEGRFCGLGTLIPWGAAPEV